MRNIIFRHKVTGEYKTEINLTEINQYEKTNLKKYMVERRSTMENREVIASNAQDAAQMAGWTISECYIQTTERK